MTTMMDDRKRKEPNPLQQRLAGSITLITFLLMTVIAVMTLFFIAPEDKSPIDNFMMPLVALTAGYSFYLTQRGAYVRGVYVLLGTIVAAALVYSIVVDNVGWQAAIGMLVIVTGITNGTLPETIARRITTSAFVVAVGIVLADLLLPGLIEFPVTTSSIIVTGILGVIYAGLILSRFRQFALRTKLIITFAFLGFISVGAAAIAISQATLVQLNEKVQQQLTSVSTLISSSFSAELDKQVDLLRTLAGNRTLLAGLVKASLEGESDPEALKALDEEWMAIPLENNMHPLIRAVLENEVSTELKEFQDAFPEHAEIFVTDRYGASFAATNRTSDYYQADEEWWLASYNNGLGGVYISQPAFDESAQIIAIQIAVPVFRFGTDEVTGILRTTVNISVFQEAFASGRFGETGRTEIYLPDGQEMEYSAHDGEHEIELEEAPTDFRAVLQENRVFYDTTHDGTPVLAVVSPLRVSGDEAGSAARRGWAGVSSPCRTGSKRFRSWVRQPATPRLWVWEPSSSPCFWRCS
ncbi:MAG: cache domain-containing protein [Chloroflexi bacterium]|nr:cache domain-containing protein [Chloroflexota bacterium]